MLFLGDSLTYGYDVPYGRGWVELSMKTLKETYPITYTNAGINGDTLQGMIYRLEHYVEANSNYDYIWIMGGSNDLLMGRTGIACYEKLLKLVAIAKRTSATVIVGIPMESILDYGDFNREVATYRNYIVDGAQSSDVKQSYQIIDFYAIIHDLLAQQQLVFAGDVHPNEAGYKAMSDVFTSTMHRVFEKRNV